MKPTTDEQFGHYLAGIIEGDGHFSTKQQLVIVFHSLDASLAYFLKERIGFGNIRKVKNKNAFILVIAAKEGIEKVIKLINGKIRTVKKYNQIIKNIFSNERYVEFSNRINLKLNNSSDFKNHWLAGFSDADASFQIKVVALRKFFFISPPKKKRFKGRSEKQKKKVEIRLNFQIDQKEKDVLISINQFLGGNIGYRNSQDTYYYGSTSFGSAKNVINYFDNFHLLSTKHINYLKWRNAFLLIQNKEHLNKEGVCKIIKLKNSMNRKQLRSKNKENIGNSSHS